MLLKRKTSNQGTERDEPAVRPVASYLVPRLRLGTPEKVRLLHKAERRGPGQQPETDTTDDGLDHQGRALLCRACGLPITRASVAIPKNGAHEHTFFNPAGIVFLLGCFARAPGCLVHGPPSTEFSWFTGHCWQFATCAGCLGHLGWFFSGAEDSFFGLILDRLVEGSGPENS